MTDLVQFLPVPFGLGCITTVGRHSSEGLPPVFVISPADKMGEVGGEIEEPEDVFAGIPDGSVAMMFYTKNSLKLVIDRLTILHDNTEVVWPSHEKVVSAMGVARATMQELKNDSEA